MTDASDTDGQSTADDGTTITTRVGRAVETLDPAYFGFVMSTGIVSIAFLELDAPLVARPLAALTVACYALLLALFAVRTAAFPERTLADLRDRNRHWGTLTFVGMSRAVGTVLLGERPAADSPTEFT